MTDSETPDQADISVVVRTENFRKDLTNLINAHSLENGSDTPDFVLAEYVIACLVAYEAAVVTRGQLAGEAR